MSEEEREPISNRTSASEAESAFKILLSQLRAGEATYTEIYQNWVAQIEMLRNAADEAYASADKAPTIDLKNLQMQRALALQHDVMTAFLGQLIAMLGEDVSRSHQRLADVEKALQELRAALPGKSFNV